MRSMSTFYQNRVSTAMSCWPTERHAHYWLSKEVYRRSEFQTPDRDAVTLRQRLRDLLTHGSTSQGGEKRAAPTLRFQL